MTTPTLTLPIVAGRKYVRRNGAIITARPHAHPGLATTGADKWAVVWIKSGLACGAEGDHPHDLVADYIEPAATSVPAPAQPHPYAHILRAIADGQIIQLRHHDSVWCDAHANAILEMIGAGTYKQQGIRIKPAMITINGREVPAPLRDKPRRGEDVYAVDLATTNLCAIHTWEGTNGDARLLVRGLLHTTREAAQAHAKALLAPTSTAFDLK